MALETLKNVKEIGGFKVAHLERQHISLEECLKIVEGKFVIVNDEANTISFTIQNNPVVMNEVGGHIDEHRWDTQINKERCMNQEWKDFVAKYRNDYTGVNGCQVDTLIHAAKLILEGLNGKFPCRDNALAITKLDEAIMWLEKRTKDREARNVEGTSQA